GPVRRASPDSATAAGRRRPAWGRARARGEGESCQEALPRGLRLSEHDIPPWGGHLISALVDALSARAVLLEALVEDPRRTGAAVKRLLLAKPVVIGAVVEAEQPVE